MKNCMYKNEFMKYILLYLSECAIGYLMIGYYVHILWIQLVIFPVERKKQSEKQKTHKPNQNKLLSSHILYNNVQLTGNCGDTHSELVLVI